MPTKFEEYLRQFRQRRQLQPGSGSSTGTGSASTLASGSSSSLGSTTDSSEADSTFAVDLYNALVASAAAAREVINIAPRLSKSLPKPQQTQVHASARSLRANIATVESPPSGWFMVRAAMNIIQGVTLIANIADAVRRDDPDTVAELTNIRAAILKPIYKFLRDHSGTVAEMGLVLDAMFKYPYIITIAFAFSSLVATSGTDRTILTRTAATAGSLTTADSMVKQLSVIGLLLCFVSALYEFNRQAETQPEPRASGRRTNPFKRV